MGSYCKGPHRKLLLLSCTGMLRSNPTILMFLWGKTRCNEGQTKHSGWSGLFSLPLDTFLVLHRLLNTTSGSGSFGDADFWRWENRQGKPPFPYILGNMVWFRFKRTKNHFFQPLPPSQAAPSSRVPPGLGHFQGFIPALRYWPDGFLMHPTIALP